MIGKEEQAEFLLEAMPYIEKYQNKILVVKYGGNAMTDDELKLLVMRDMTLLRFVGIKVVLVHGGGPEISQTMKRMGIESRFVNGLRYTDEETAEVVRMVLAGKARWVPVRSESAELTEICSGAARRAKSSDLSARSNRSIPIF